MNGIYKLLLRLNYVAYVILDILAWVSGEIKYGFILLIPLVLFPFAVSIAENITISKADKFFLSEWNVFLKKLEWGNAAVICIVCVVVFLCTPKQKDNNHIDAGTNVKKTSLNREIKTDYQQNTYQFKEERNPSKQNNSDKIREKEKNLTSKKEEVYPQEVVLPEQDFKKSDNSNSDDKKKKKEAKRDNRKKEKEAKRKKKLQNKNKNH